MNRLISIRTVGPARHLCRATTPPTRARSRVWSTLADQSSGRMLRSFALALSLTCVLLASGCSVPSDDVAGGAPAASSAEPQRDDTPPIAEPTSPPLVEKDASGDVSDTEAPLISSRVDVDVRAVAGEVAEEASSGSAVSLAGSDDEPLESVVSTDELSPAQTGATGERLTDEDGSAFEAATESGPAAQSVDDTVVSQGKTVEQSPAGSAVSFLSEGDADEEPALRDTAQRVPAPGDPAPRDTAARQRLLTAFLRGEDLGAQGLDDEGERSQGDSGARSTTSEPPAVDRPNDQGLGDLRGRLLRSARERSGSLPPPQSPGATENEPNQGGLRQLSDQRRSDSQPSDESAGRRDDGYGLEAPPPRLRSGAAPPRSSETLDVSPGGNVPGSEGEPATNGSTARAANVKRPGDDFEIVTLHHKTAGEFLRFVREHFPVWIEAGYLLKIEGKAHSLMVFGVDAEDATRRRIIATLERFDLLEVKPTQEFIRPRYIDAKIALDAIAMRGLAKIWVLTDETKTASWKEGENTMTASYRKEVYAPQELAAGEAAPVDMRPTIPYVYELPSVDPFEIPEFSAGEGNNETKLVRFDQTSSTERRGGFIAVGTEENIAEIKAFVEEIDQPAKLVMIEVQVIELDANKFLDLGIDSIQFGEGHTVGGISLPLPGEPIVQPGLGDAARADPNQFVPELTQEGLSAIFDDTSVDLSGRFIGNIHALVREGNAKIKARPKILTLDDRMSVLHIGQDVPVFESTSVTRDATDGNLVSEVQEVGTQYVGFTLNIRPRVTGGAEDRIALQVEVIVNALGERQRVFEEDLAGIPAVITRRYIGMPLVKNHRPIVLGGLIQEEEVESINKIPLLGDIPLLGYLFRRTQKTQSRNEVIFVLTPHILSQKGVDRQGTPKESPIFDTFDSALFNDKHIIKGRDVLGIDPITGNPAVVDGKQFSKEEVVDLTLLNIIKQRELISKLGILDDYLSDALSDLNWLQRKWPERTVGWWSARDQEVFFRASAILIENIKELNSDLTYEELTLPRREIVLPTTPFRISLSYDQVHELQLLGAPLLRGERVELDEETLGVLREAGDRSLLDFAEFLERRQTKAEDHGELIVELKRYYGGLRPDSSKLESIAYAEIYRELAAEKVNFTGLATYLRENLATRYRDFGAPDVGSFAQDVTLFLKSSVTLFHRGKRLRQLETKWMKIGEPPTEQEDSNQ